MDEKLKRDYQRICEAAYHAKNIEQAQVPLFYLYLICQQFDFDNSGISLRCGTVEGKARPLMQEALWCGVASCLWASPCHIVAFRPRPINSYRGRLLKIEIDGVEHRPYNGGEVITGIEEIIAFVEDLHRVTPQNTQIKPYPFS